MPSSDLLVSPVPTCPAHAVPDTADAARWGGPGLVVVKLGGRVQADAALPHSLAALWSRAPGRVAIVHGGGADVSALQRALAVEPRFVEGRRVTSERDLELLRMALSGAANKRLVSALVSAGVSAVGISGEDAGLLVAEQEPAVALGFVGVEVRAHVRLITHLLTGGFLPVLSPVARAGCGAESAAAWCDAESAAAGCGAESAAVTCAPATLNVNGDDAAAAIAASLGASDLLFVSDVPGVMVDGVPLGELTVEAASQLMARGVATGGMRVKLAAALGALERGVARVRVGGLSLLSGRPDAGTLIHASGTSGHRAGAVSFSWHDSEMRT